MLNLVHGDLIHHVFGPTYVFDRYSWENDYRGETTLFIYIIGDDERFAASMFDYKVMPEISSRYKPREYAYA